MMYQTLQRHPLLSRKGAAAPSPEHHLAADRLARHAPTPETGPIDGDNLAGLIKRRGETRTDMKPATPDAGMLPREDDPPSVGGRCSAPAGSTSPALRTPVVGEPLLSLATSTDHVQTVSRPIAGEGVDRYAETARQDCSTERRQLTVRVDMAEFHALDRMARTSGRSYQDLLVSAVRCLLRGRRE